MGKILTVCGQGGAGKSTFAVNLACGLAEKQKVVILLSTQLNYGSLQVFLGETISADKGILMALHDKTEQPTKFLTQCKANQNIYLMSTSNDTDEVNYSMFSKHAVDVLYRKLSLAADYLIIDSTVDPYNGLTLMGIAKADTLYCIYKSTAGASLWHHSYPGFLNQLTYGTMKAVVSLHNLGCSLSEFLNVSELKPDVLLPNVNHAAFLENSGIPIYYDKGKESEKYRTEINQATETIILGSMGGDLDE